MAARNSEEASLDRAVNIVLKYGAGDVETELGGRRCRRDVRLVRSALVRARYEIFIQPLSEAVKRRRAVSARSVRYTPVPAFQTPLVPHRPTFVLGAHDDLLNALAI